MLYTYADLRDALPPLDAWLDIAYDRGLWYDVDGSQRYEPFIAAHVSTGGHPSMWFEAFDDDLLFNVFSSIVIVR